MVDKDGDPLTVDDQGTLGIPPGNYYLIEVAAPEGYLLDQTPILFHLDDATIPDNNPDGTIGLVKRVSNEKIQYGVRVQKTDAENGEPLPGAVFTIASADDPDTPLALQGADGEFTVQADGQATQMGTDLDGILTISGLEKGETYLLTETQSPQGYVKPQNAFRVIIPDITTPSEPNTILEGNTLLLKTTIANERLRGQMILYKRDGDTQEPLAGAEFQLYRRVSEIIDPDDPDYDPTLPDPQYRTRTEEVGAPKASDSEGRVVFYGLDWNDDDSEYFVQEISAPQGYLVDASNYPFSIDQYSFQADGTPIPVVHNAYNIKGTMGSVRLTKIDADDPNQKLEGAHFALFKEVEGGGSILYGNSIYITDTSGEIYITLPPGNYYFREMSPPDGYLPQDAFQIYRFAISDNGGEEESITVTNTKGEAGLILQKTITGTNIPIEGVVFHLYKGVPAQQLMQFEKLDDGLYQYAENAVEGQTTTDVETDADGIIRILFPKELTTGGFDNIIMYEEISAPEGVKIESGPAPIWGVLPGMNDGFLVEDLWLPTQVNNQLKESFSIIVNKTSGNSRLPLAGATFELRAFLGENADGTEIEVPIGNPVTTDEQGIARFDNVDPSFTYHLVETKAPDGYVLNEVHREIVVDSSNLDEDYSPLPIHIFAQNGIVHSQVTLTKVDGDTGAGLEGAEFELFKQENGEWMHYGEYRYTTDSQGQIQLDLPYGEYYWIERAPVDGYLLDDTPINFGVTDGRDIFLTAENTPDPGPKGSVQVIKSDEDTGELLPGASFRLYRLGADGQWHIYRERLYTTDENGTFEIVNLSAGSYCFREMQAPEGYRLDTETEHRFTIQTDGETIRLEIANQKETPTTDPDNPGTDPDNPGTDPDTPGTDPDNPGTDPDIPGTDPDNPGTDPDTPGTDPDDPGTIPIPDVNLDDPGTDPDDPGTDPDDPGTEPDDPGTDPVTLGQSRTIPERIRMTLGQSRTIRQRIQMTLGLIQIIPEQSRMNPGQIYNLTTFLEIAAAAKHYPKRDRIGCLLWYWLPEAYCLSCLEF